MSLRTLYIAMLATFLALTTLLVVWIHGSYFKPLISEVEKRIYSEDAGIVKSLTSLRHDHMVVRLRGFAKWGKLDRFLSLSPEEREKYRDDHLQWAQPVDESFSILAIFDRRRELVFGNVIDRENRYFLPATDKVTRWLEQNAPDLFDDPGKEATGFICYESEPGLLASVPVLDQETGEAVGRVVGIDFMDPVVLSRLANLSNGEFELIDDDRDPRIQQWVKTLDDDGFVNIANDKVYSTVFIPKKMNGSRCYGIAFKRRIEGDRFAREALIAMIASALAAFFLFVVLSAFVQERYIIKPVDNITLTIKRMLGTGGQKVEIDANDYLEPLRALAGQVKRLAAERSENEAERIKMKELNLNQERLTDALGSVIGHFLAGEPGCFQHALSGMAELLDLDFVAFYSLLDNDLMRSAKFFRHHRANSSNQLSMVGDRIDWVGRLIDKGEMKTLYVDGIFPEGFEDLKQIMEYYRLKRTLCVPLKGSRDGADSGMLFVGSSHYTDSVWSLNEKRILSLTGSLLLAMSVRMNDA